MATRISGAPVLAARPPGEPGQAPGRGLGLGAAQRMDPRAGIRAQA